MSDTRFGSSGSISGFDTFSTDQSGTTESVTPSFFSKALDREALLALRADLDPARLIALTTQMMAHINNENNPHDDTEANIGINVFNDFYMYWISLGNQGTVQQFANILFQTIAIATVQQILNNDSNALVDVSGANALIAYHNADPNAHPALISEYFMGTVPPANPAYCMMAMIGVPDFNVTTSCDTPTTYIDQSGTLQTAPIQTIPIDYLTGKPRYSVWDGRTNFLPISSPLTLGAVLTGMQPITNDPNTLSPTRNPMCLVLSDVVGQTTEYSYAYPVQLQSNTEYTDSIFIYPKASSGYIYLTITAVSEPAGTSFSAQAYFNITTGEVTAITSGILVYCYPLASGWYRIGIQYITPTATSFSAPMTTIAYAPSLNSFTYTGTGAQLFALDCLQHAVGPGVSPYIPTTGTPVATTGSQLTINIGTTTAANPTNGIIGITFLQSSTLTNSFTRTLIQTSDGNLTVTSTPTLVSGAIGESGEGNIAVQSPVSYDSIDSTHLALSWSPTDFIIKVAGQNRVDTQGIYRPINSTMQVFEIGALDGYLDSFVIYSITDQGNNLEFVTG